MKTIMRVAKTELRTLFYSPIAWFLMIVFLIQCGVVYISQLESNARTQEIGGIGLQYMSNLTERIFLSPRGLFGSVMQNLYLFIPLLTMSLISRETSSGTIKLLYSSPIKVRQIILGKFFSMMIYSLLLVAIVGIFIVSGMFHVQSPETGILMTAMLGFYLLLCAYSAIGLFMSCLTTYQVVAAICTFVMIGILSYIGTLWQSIAFVRELTYFLSINGRTQKMLAGLLTTKDVIYFIVIVYMFLGFSILKLKGGMESKPAIVKALRYVAVVASALLIGYVSSVPGFIGYYDATANKTRTLTPNAQKILAQLGDEPLQITAYNNLLGRYWYYGGPESYNMNLGRWEPYMRFKPNIELNTVCYYDSAFDNPWMLKGYPGKSLKEIAEQYSKSMDLSLKGIKTPEEIKKIIDLKPEMNRYVMQLKWKGRTTWLRVFDDQMSWPSETEVSAAFQRLQQAKLPKVAFLTGDLERSIDKIGDKDYKALTNLSTFRYSLVNQGFDVDTVSLETQEIPADISTLVIGDPKMPFSPTVMARLQAYIAKGGNLMIAGEPGRQSVLNPLLQQIGVQMMDGQIVQQSADMSPDLVLNDILPVAGTFTKSVAKGRADSQKVSMPGAAALSYTPGGPFTVQPLLMTDSALSWNKKKKLDLDMVESVDATAKETAAPQVTQMPPSKRGDSLRTAMAAIMNGEGTQEEKAKKVREMLQKIGKQAAPTVTTGTVPVQGAKPVEKPKEVEKPQAAANAIVMTSAVPAGGGMMMASGYGPQRPAFTGKLVFSAAEGDTRGSFPTVLALSRQVNGKEQRIVVLGDADIMSNAELNRFNMRTANFVFNTALFSWLNYGEFPIDTSRPDAKDRRVKVTLSQVQLFRILYIWVLPAILLLFGTVLLIRRKRK